MDLLVFDRNIWNHLTVNKQMISGSFKNNVIYKLLTNKTHADKHTDTQRDPP